MNIGPCESGSFTINLRKIGWYGFAAITYYRDIRYSFNQFNHR